MNCKVCGTDSPIFMENGRCFFRCPSCWFIFTPDTISRQEEEHHYKSQWEITDEDIWGPKADSLLQLAGLYSTPRSILDFGSGSGELTKAFLERGIPTTPLEPMVHGFLKDQKYDTTFDMVVGVEVIEHLPDFWDELREIEKVLSPNGIMIFSTLLTNSFIESQESVAIFNSWWYKDDPTHLNFFCNRSLKALADRGAYTIDVYGEQAFVVRPQPS